MVPLDAQELFLLALFGVSLFFLTLLIFSPRNANIQEPPSSPQNNIASPPKSTVAAPAAKGEYQWWASPLASSAEQTLIAQALLIVRGEGLDPLPPNADIELLRLLRGPVQRGGPPALAKHYAWALRWRRDNVVWPVGATATAGPSRLWPPASEHANGRWALANGRMHIGLAIGRSRGGHVVKLERLGDTDISGICDEVGGDERLLGHYYSLLETMLLALNAESRASGNLLRMYEIFDLKGLSPRHCSFLVIRTVTKLLRTIISVYAETTVRAVLLNLPRSIAATVRMLLNLLPDRVRYRVLVLGEGEVYDFSKELDDDALSRLYDDQPKLMAHSGEPLSGAALPPNESTSWKRPGRPQPASESHSSSSNGGASSTSVARRQPTAVATTSTSAASSSSSEIVRRPTGEGGGGGQPDFHVACSAIADRFVTAVARCVQPPQQTPHAPPPPRSMPGQWPPNVAPI